jgi:hypothetical protein
MLSQFSDKGVAGCGCCRVRRLMIRETKINRVVGFGPKKCVIIYWRKRSNRYNSADPALKGSWQRSIFPLPDDEVERVKAFLLLNNR